MEVEMEDISLEGVAEADLIDLRERVVEAIQIARSAKAVEVTNSRTALIGVIAQLDALLGNPEQAPYDPNDPNTVPTIISVNKHTEQTLAENSGLALKLILSGMEALTKTVRDLAVINSN